MECLRTALGYTHGQPTTSQLMESLSMLKPAHRASPILGPKKPGLTSHSLTKECNGWLCCKPPQLFGNRHSIERCKALSNVHHNQGAKGCCDCDSLLLTTPACGCPLPTQPAPGKNAGIAKILLRSFSPCTKACHAATHETLQPHPFPSPPACTAITASSAALACLLHLLSFRFTGCGQPVHVKRGKAHQRGG